MADEIARMKAEDNEEEDEWRANLTHGSSARGARAAAEKMLTYEELAQEKEARREFALAAEADRREANLKRRKHRADADDQRDFQLYKRTAFTEAFKAFFQNWYE